MGIIRLLRADGLGLRRVRCITKKRNREFTRDCNQLALDRIKKLVEPTAQNRGNIERAEQYLEPVELLGRIVSAAQPMARFDLAEQSADFAHTVMDGARESGVEQ